MTGTALDRRPTRFSTIVVVAVTVVVTGVLVAEVGLVGRALYGAGGALALALVLGLLAHDRLHPLGAAIEPFAFLAIALALIVGVGYTVAAQLRGTVPVGSVFLIVGATVAVFGTVLAVRDVLDRGVLVRCLSTGLRALVVVGSAMTVAVLLRFVPLGQRVAGAFETATTALFSPSGAVPLASFLVLGVGCVLVTRAAVLALPIEELLGDRLDSGTRRAAAILDRYVRIGAVPLVVGTGLALLIEQRGTTSYGWLPPGVRDAVGTLTQASAVRVALGAVTVVSLTLLAVAWVLQRSYRTSNRAALIGFVPYASGGVLTAATLWAYDPFLDALIDRTSRRLPAPMTGPFEEVVDSVLAFYGERLVALMVVAGMLLVTVLLVLGLLVTVVLGLLTERASGASLAAGGLFMTAAFAAVLGASLPVALGGVVASLFVWDVGEFGVTLGRETGAGAATIRTELTHGGGTLLVGAGTITVAFLLEDIAVRADVGAVPVVPALLGAIAGALLLVAASR